MYWPNENVKKDSTKTKTCKTTQIYRNLNKMSNDSKKNKMYIHKRKRLNGGKVTSRETYNDNTKT